MCQPITSDFILYRSIMRKVVTIHGILGVTSRPPFDKRSEYGEIFTIAYISVCPRPATVLIVTFHDILVESCCDFFKQILPRGLNGFYYG